MFNSLLKYPIFIRDYEIIIYWYVSKSFKILIKKIIFLFLTAEIDAEFKKKKKKTVLWVVTYLIMFWGIDPERILYKKKYLFCLSFLVFENEDIYMTDEQAEGYGLFHSYTPHIGI